PLASCRAAAGARALGRARLAATAHGRAGARQPVLEDWEASGGLVALAPVHVSATPQGPAEGRQTVPALPAGWLHAPALQVSVVQGFPSSVQPVPFGWKASGGQAELGGGGAMSWISWAVLVLGDDDVDGFEPRAAGLVWNGFW